MKIGIISINLYSKWLNFACPLHSYAMQQFLLENGYGSKIIDYKASYYDNYNMRHPADYYKEKFEVRKKNFPAVEAKRNDWAESVKLTAELERNYRALYDERVCRYDKFQSFIEKHLDVTEKGYNSVTMELEDPGFDCYMCVTDVIWKAEPSLERAFFLANRSMDKKHKIAYSASRGSSHTCTEKDEKLFFDYLRDFDAISVREPSLKEHIEEKSELNATVVLDPVMLHDKSFYEKIAVAPEEKGYMFLYHVVQSAEDTIEQAVKYAKEHNLTIIESSDRPYPTGKLDKYEVEHKWIYDIGIEQWLGYIMNADCVFTNSFHCCCFSILFGRNFFAGSRNGDKIDVVLDTFGLGSRRFDIDTDLSGSAIEDIDYEKVYEKLGERRKESASFILGALERAQKTPAKSKSREEERKTKSYSVYINMCLPDEEKSVSERITSSPEYRSNSVKFVNNGKSVLNIDNPFLQGYRFVGWKLRVKIDNDWLWFMKDGSFAYDADADEENIRLFKKGSKIGYIPADGIDRTVAVAQWEKIVPTFEFALNSGLKTDRIISEYSEKKGTLNITGTGRYEYSLKGYFENDGSLILPENLFVLTETQDECEDEMPAEENDTAQAEEPTEPEQEKEEIQTVFTGWKLRVHFEGEWCWYMKDGTLCPASQQPSKKEIRHFLPGEKLPVFPEGLVLDVIAVAQWRKAEIILVYHSGTLAAEEAAAYVDENSGTLAVTPKGAYEYVFSDRCHIHTRLSENCFVPSKENDRREFLGWRIRIKHRNVWKRYLEDDTFIKMQDYSVIKHGNLKTVKPGVSLAQLNLPKGAFRLVAEAVWYDPKAKVSLKAKIIRLLCKLYRK